MTRAQAQSIANSEHAREVREDDYNHLELIVTGRLNDISMYVAEDKKLDLIVKFKIFKGWFLRNIGPSVSIFVTVTGTIISVVIYVLEFLEESKHKIDDIKSRVHQILKEIDKDNKSELQSLEAVNKNTFKKTLLQFADTFLDESEKVVQFIHNHLGLLALLVFSLYELSNDKSFLSRRMKHRVKKELKDRVHSHARSTVKKKIEDYLK